MLRRYAVFALLAAFAVSVRPPAASAAPFCVQITGMTPQCAYFDPGQCRKRAEQLNALCVGNPDELKIVPGSGRYCMVNASRAAVCIYPDMQSCNHVAGQEGSAVCVDSAPLQVEQDPYRTEPERRY